MDDLQRRVKAAVWLASQGFGIVAVPMPTKSGDCTCPASSLTRKDSPDRKCKSPGKHPLGEAWQKHAAHTEAEVRAIFAGPRGALMQYGAFPEPGSGLMVIDEDVPGALQHLIPAGKLLPDTFIVLTSVDPASGQRKSHHYYRCKDDSIVPSSFAGGEIRVAGSGHVVGPWGRHITGIEYEPGAYRAIAEAPDWLIAALRASKHVAQQARATEDPADPNFIISKGAGRHPFLVDKARFLRKGGLRGPELVAKVLELNQTRCDPPYPDSEVTRLVEWIDDHIEENPPPRLVLGPTVTVVRERDEGTIRLPAGLFPPDLPSVAFDGPAGDAVDTLQSYTSASRAGLLTSVLSISGAVLATTGSYYGRQTSSFLTALVGETGALKGTAMDVAWRALGEPPAFGDQHGVIIKGAGSGEAIPGTADRRMEKHGIARMLLKEGELASMMIVAGRKGSILSTVLRDAFDNQPLASFLKASEIIVPPDRYQLGMLAGITPSELRQLLAGGSDMVNGWANRILWVPVQAIPGWQPLDARGWSLTSVAEPFKLALEWVTGHRHEAINPTDEAVELLSEYYAMLSRLRGTRGALSRRLATIAFRLGLVHASLERSAEVTHDHVSRGIALCEYSRAGLGWVFGGSATGSPDAQHVLRSLLTRGGGLSWYELAVEAWGNHYRKERMVLAVDELEDAGFVEVVRVATGAAGRPTTRVRALEDGDYIVFLPVPRAHARGEDTLPGEIVWEPGMKLQNEIKEEVFNRVGNRVGNEELNGIEMGHKSPKQCFFPNDHELSSWRVVDAEVVCLICRAVGAEEPEEPEESDDAAARSSLHP